MADPGVAYNPLPWSNFFAAEAAAAAALIGLLFVSVSINLPQVVQTPQLTTRAAKTLATLGLVLLVSTLGLVPGQAAATIGVELAVIGLVAWVAITMLEQGASSRNPYVSWRGRLTMILLTQGSTLPFAVGGVSVAVMRGGGLRWLVGGIALAFCAALADAWVLLIEIRR